MADKTFDEAKFIELVLYIAQSTMDDPDFGSIKMNKALWRSDFNAYARYGESITGATYIKLEFGPAPHQLPPLLTQMQERRIAELAEQTIAGFDSKRIVALRPADVEVFTPRELALIHSVIDDVRARTAMRLSQESHRIGWEMADMKETIPYEAALLPDVQPAPSERAIAMAKAVAEQIASGR
jgi:hypothetical protein